MKTYYDDIARDWTCEKCGWKGKCSEAPGETFDDLCEVDCPKCHSRLGLLVYPTTEEVRQAAAQGHESAKTDLMMVEIKDARWNRFEREKLKSPDDLPELSGAHLHITWDESNGDLWEQRTVLRIGSRVLWEEPVFYEGWWRYNEVKEILRVKYGERFCALIPTQKSMLNLLGDDLGAPREIALEELEDGGLVVWDEPGSLAS